MRFFRLLGAYLRLNLQEGLAYRADMALNIVMNLLWLGWELVSLQIIFGNTSNISGWSMGDLIALLGVWRLAHTLMSIVIWPNTMFFNSAIRSGSFDYNLLQPVYSQVQVSFSRLNILRIWELALAVGLILYGMRVSGIEAGILQVLSFILLSISGISVLYSLWIVLIALVFWFVKFDNNVTILQAFMDTGRYPVMVYPPWLRLIVTFLIPIAVATTIPLQALRGDLNLSQTLLYLAVAVAAQLVAMLVWRAGVKRYSGASA